MMQSPSQHIGRGMEHYMTKRYQQLPFVESLSAPVRACYSIKRFQLGHIKRAFD